MTITLSSTVVRTRTDRSSRRWSTRAVALALRGGQEQYFLIALRSAALSANHPTMPPWALIICSAAR